MSMSREVKEYCGLFGAYGIEEASWQTFLGLYSLQHRGEESCGITSYDGRSFYHHRGLGLISEAFKEDDLKQLKGDMAIGHVRYSTTGSTAVRNIQPLFINSQGASVALAHNGNLVNSRQLRDKLERKGSIFQTSSDSEIILHLLMRSKKDSFILRLIDALERVKGAYSLVILTQEGIIGVRDPFGFRPLCIGKKDNGYIISSESCALDITVAQFIREVEPGEIVAIGKEGVKSYHFGNNQKHAFCSFEHIYFSRPDSIIFGETVHVVREKLGRQLAREHPVKADLVIGVPDSGTSAALGFSKEANIPLEVGIIRNHYIGRTFIQPQQGKREFQVKLKFNILKQVIKGKSIVIVDDSIVRGTTSKIRVRNFRQLGANKVHLRISCPPHRFGCFYGIDFPSREKLLAYRMSPEEIRDYLEVDSIGYLSLEGMLKCFKFPPENYCTACWSGKYPIPFKKGDKFALE